MTLLILYDSSEQQNRFQQPFLTGSWRDQDGVKVVMRPTNGVGEKIPWQPSENTGNAIAATHPRRNIPAGVETVQTSKFREIVAPGF
jgi:hypothetical protein